jgi:hypothetical protein
MDCSNAEGDLEDICKWLVELTHLEIGRYGKAGSTKLELGQECDQESMKKLRIPWISGCIKHIPSNLKNILVVNLSMVRPLIPPTFPSSS